jgi:hypothetical protein
MEHDTAPIDHQRIIMTLELNMKTISGWILGGALACSLAACSSTPMAPDTNTPTAMTREGALNRDGAVGNSDNSITNVGDMEPGKTGTRKDIQRDAVPVSCSSATAAADGTRTADIPGTKCPTDLP